MHERKGAHPAVKALLFLFLIVFFGGGLLIFVNNLIVSFLPEWVTAVVGTTVLVLFVVLMVVSKCVSAVKCVRTLGQAKTRQKEDTP